MKWSSIATTKQAGMRLALSPPQPTCSRLKCSRGIYRLAAACAASSSECLAMFTVWDLAPLPLLHLMDLLVPTYGRPEPPGWSGDFAHPSRNLLPVLLVGLVILAAILILRVPLRAAPAACALCAGLWQYFKRAVLHLDNHDTGLISTYNSYYRGSVTNFLDMTRLLHSSQIQLQVRLDL